MIRTIKKWLTRVAGGLLAALALSAVGHAVSSESGERVQISPSASVLFPFKPKLKNDSWVAQDSHLTAYVASFMSAGFSFGWFVWAVNRYPDYLRDSLADAFDAKMAELLGSDADFETEPVRIKGVVGFHFVVDDMPNGGIMKHLEFPSGTPVRADGLILFIKGGMLLTAVVQPRDAPRDPVLLRQFTEDMQIASAAEPAGDDADEQEASFGRLVMGIILGMIAVLVLIIIGIVQTVRHFRRRVSV